MATSRHQQGLPPVATPGPLLALCVLRPLHSPPRATSHERCLASAGGPLSPLTSPGQTPMTLAHNPLRAPAGEWDSGCCLGLGGGGIASGCGMSWNPPHQSDLLSKRVLRVPEQLLAWD